MESKTKLALLVAVVVACHPDGDRVQHPAEVPPAPVEAPAPQSGRSDDTALAAKRWVHASFFNRLKRKVAQNWDPLGVWRRIEPKRTMDSTETRHTEVQVSLSSGGEIVDIAVTVPSGVKELDDEGVRAFQAAAPFGELPEGLARQDGRITFWFSFYLEAGGARMAWRVPAGI